MVTLDKVMELQKQGLSETQISTQLRDEGISPQEINNSLNQAKIKNAVSPPEEMPQTPGVQGTQPPQTPGLNPSADMQQSIMQEPGQNISVSPPGQVAQAPGVQGTQPPIQALPQEQQPPTQTPSPEVYPPQETYPPQEQQPPEDYYTQTPQAYPSQDYYAPQGAVDTETISEIAEQVVTEKLDDFKKKTGDLVSFKTSIQDKVADIDERLKRIENSIDKLQHAVVGKIGEFGESNAMIHKDLDNLHDTVSKLMNPLIDNYKELRKIAK